MVESLQSQIQQDVPPLITVAMPVYNAGKYLRVAVLSIVKQTFTDWELLIIDDGSTDNALQDIADISDSRIRILQDGENKGLAVRLNEAIDLARGQYLARMDQDDVSYPERFSRQVEALQNNPELDLVAVRAITITNDDQLTGLLPYASAHEEISVKPWRGFYMPHPTWMGKIAWFRKYRYAIPGPYFCEDQELLLRSYDKSRFGMIMQPLFAYRLRSRVNWCKLLKTRLTLLQIQLRYFLLKGQLFFGLMALFTFVGRMLLDLLKTVSGVVYPLIRVNDEGILRKWQDVLNIVKTGASDLAKVRASPGNVSNQQKHIAPILWIVFFCYAIFTALIFQKLLLPLIPSLQASGGLLPNDAAYFDSIALELAEKIRLYGWGSWQLYPAPGASGNVAIVGALYALFGHDPTLIIPVNAAMHASGGLLIFLLARELSGKELIGTCAGLVAASLFVIFPSALSWYGQNLKDGYAIAGTLLILLTWVKAVRSQTDIRGWLLLIFGHSVGVLLIAGVRPYGLKVLLVATLGVWLAVIVVAILRRQLGHFTKLATFFLVAIITLAGGIKVIANTGITASLETTSVGGDAQVIKTEKPSNKGLETTSVGGNAQVEVTYANWQGNGVWQWRNASWLPNTVENYIETAARIRAGMIEYGLSMRAKSMIDEDIAPQSVEEVVAYLPRALQIASLAPFPSSWLENVSITRLVSVGEMFIYYLCIPGIFLLLLYNRKPAVLISIYFACFFLLVQGFTMANIGTLYRLRYAYLFVLLMLGVLGWFTWLEKTGRLKRLFHMLQPPAQMSTTDEVQKLPQTLVRKQAIGAGVMVMGLTFLYFVGFFLRDIMMAHTFGLGTALDNFFIALLIPMFVVSVLCMPLGAAFIPLYLDIKERLPPQVSRALVSNVSFWVTASLLITCLILYLSGPFLLPLLYFKGPTPDMGHLILLLNSALLILLFSGVVILGNSVLNANGRAVLTSTAQLIVPIFAILALVVFGDRYGVNAVMYGMVVGQLFNLLIVQFYSRQHDVTLLPKLDLLGKTELSPLLMQYLPLAVSAFFVSVAAPVATFLAMSLPEGGVSAFNLGNKVVLFVTGLVSAAISAVILPYFSSLVAKNHLMSARRELSFFLLFATLVSVPVSTGLYVWAEPIVRLVFENRAFDSNATELVARVMQYSVVQIPFFVCNMLLLKFATATKHVVAISVVAIIGLLVNVCVSMLMMRHMGVAGIALGGSVSMLASTILLVLMLVRYWHITYFDAVIMILNWLLFVTLLICVHFQSVPSIYVTMLAYAILLLGYFSSLMSDKFPRIRLRN